MSRFLFLSLPLAGHVNPMAAVSRTLVQQGHEVAWAGSESFLRPLLADDTTVYPIGLRLHRGQSDLGMTATRSRWEGYIVPHCRFTRPAVEQAVQAYRPDVMVVDQHAVAGALVAHRHGLRWASAAPTSMELTRPYRALPKVESWIHGQLAAMWTAAGLSGTPPHDLRFSPHLVIAFSSKALTGTAPLPENVEFVGAAVAGRPPGADFPWERLDPGRRHVLVTMGTLSMDIAKDFYERMVAALRSLGDRLQAIVVAPEGTVADPPEHVMVFPQVPMLDLLPRLDAVVSHGGLNTVCETLSHDVPLVIAPIKGDQPINAAQVAAAGAGIRVRYVRATPEELRTAVLAVLDDPTYRAAAARVGESLRAAGGASAAARHLALLAQPVSSLRQTELRTTDA
ncbi:MAG: MGT family glycosyltransferase [Actinobacteria bacterium 13_2_20CM_2_71_6]|nr:MAG: MGT family glycosyltransferase [Actinobacteria bacterium 13_2_20CM_2_71_6]